MPRLRNLALVSAIALGLSAPLSGCSMYKLEELRHTTPSGTPFQNELSRLYMDFASEEEKAYDWSDSWYFADKGLRLAYGRDAGPEELKDWDIPAAVLPELEHAREALMSALTQDAVRVSPARAAAAQFYFDCWVEQQEENWQEDDIAYCRDNFTQALQDLRMPSIRTAESVVEKPAPAKAPKKAHRKINAASAAPAPAAMAAEAPAEKQGAADELPATAVVEPQVEKPVESPAKKPAEPVTEKPAKPSKAKKESKDMGDAVTETTSYAVFFETNKAQVSEPGMNVITEIIKSLQGVSNYVVLLHTSKDRPGMAAERIHVVRKLLVAGGVKESAIKVASGSADADSKPVARRVEVFLNE